MKSQMKTVVAIVGGFVVIAMGVLTVATGGNEANADDKGVAGTTITMGMPPSIPPTAKAQPILKARAWKCGNFASKC